MNVFSTDVLSITAARARLTELAADVVASGRPKILTRNGESYIAMMGVEDLDEYRRLRAADHLRNLHNLSRATRDISNGKTISVAQFRKRVNDLVAQDSAKAPVKGKAARLARK